MIDPLSIKISKEIYDVAKDIKQGYDALNGLKNVAMSEGKDQIVATKHLAETTRVKGDFKIKEIMPSDKDLEIKGDLWYDNNNKDINAGNGIFVDRLDEPDVYQHLESEDIVDKLSNIAIPKETNNISEQFIDILSSEDDVEAVAENNVESTEIPPTEIKNEFKDQEALDWLKCNYPDVYDNVSGTFEEGRSLSGQSEKLVCNEMADGSVEISMDYPWAEPSKVVIKGDVVYANSGCDPSKEYQACNMFLDDSMPNKTYVIDGNTTFQTDDLGRTILAEQDRTNPIDNVKPGLDKDRRKLVGQLKEGLDSTTEDAGHILQRNLGGINEVINLVPMDNDWQRSGGEWRSLESKEESLIKEAQNNGAKNIVSRRELIYEGDSKRPSKIKFETIIDGETKISEIVNCPSKS